MQYIKSRFNLYIFNYNYRAKKGSYDFQISDLITGKNRQSYARTCKLDQQKFSKTAAITIGYSEPYLKLNFKYT